MAVTLGGTHATVTEWMSEAVIVAVTASVWPTTCTTDRAHRWALLRYATLSLATLTFQAAQRPNSLFALINPEITCRPLTGLAEARVSPTGPA